MTSPFGRATAYTLILLLAGAPAAAQVDPRKPDAAEDGERGSAEPDATERRDEGREIKPLSSEPEKGAPRGRNVPDPVGPAMDGVRGSAPAAPGAFGTDAGSPSDLRR